MKIDRASWKLHMEKNAKVNFKLNKFSVNDNSNDDIIIISIIMIISY